VLLRDRHHCQPPSPAAYHDTRNAWYTRNIQRPNGRSGGQYHDSVHVPSVLHGRYQARSVTHVVYPKRCTRDPLASCSYFSRIASLVVAFYHGSTNGSSAFSCKPFPGMDIGAVWKLPASAVNGLTLFRITEESECQAKMGNYRPWLHHFEDTHQFGDACALGRDQTRPLNSPRS
jgi:hypothetical protein